MDTIFPSSRISYRAITSPTLQEMAYAVIIAGEAMTAVLCWIGVAALVRRLHADASTFNRAKSVAIVGLTVGFLLWNGVPSAFRFLMTCIAVLIFLAIPDQELDRKEAV